MWRAQADMTPAQAVSLWPDLEAAAATYNIPLGSASCSTCASCAPDLRSST